MTNKSKTVAILLVLIGVFLFSGCNLSKKKSNGQNGEKEQTKENLVVQQTKEDNSGQLNLSLKELIQLNKNLKCQWSFDNQKEKMNSKGIVYVSGEKFRQEMEILEGAEGDKNQKFFAVSDGEWFYSWDSLSKKGSKIKVKDIDKIGQSQNQQKTETENYQMDWEKKIDYHCEDWVANDDLFKPDSSVEFIDMMEMLKQSEAIMNKNQNNLQDLCKMCEQLPAANRAECLKSCQQ